MRCVLQGAVQQHHVRSGLLRAPETGERIWFASTVGRQAVHVEGSAGGLHRVWWTESGLVKQPSARQGFHVQRGVERDGVMVAGNREHRNPGFLETARNLAHHGDEPFGGPRIVEQVPAHQDSVDVLARRQIRQPPEGGQNLLAPELGGRLEAGIRRTQVNVRQVKKTNHARCPGWHVSSVREPAAPFRDECIAPAE